MKLRCGVHNERESAARPMFVCHHCGMPVCEEHGWVVLSDDAFHEIEEPVSRAAMHCPECVAAFHPRGASKRRGWLVRQLRPVGQNGPAGAQPQAAQPQAAQPQAAQPQAAQPQAPQAQQPPALYGQPPAPYGQPPGYGHPPAYGPPPGYNAPGPYPQQPAP